MSKMQRILQVATYLLEQPKEEYTNSRKLAELTGVSTKTVLKDLKSLEIRKILGNATIERKEHVGIRLIASSDQRKKLANTLYELLRTDKLLLPSSLVDSNDFEKICLVLLQSKDGVKKEELAAILYRDSSNLDAVIKETERFVAQFEVTLSKNRASGFELAGKEEKIRELFRNIILQKIIIDKPDQLGHQASGIYLPIKKRLKKIFDHTILDFAIDMIDKAELNLNERFTNYDYEILVTKLCIKISRMKLGKFIQTDNAIDESIREHLVAHLIIFQIDEVFNLEYSLYEHKDLTEIILSTRRINQKTKEDAVLLDEQVFHEFILFVESGLGVELTSDEELKKNLLDHILPAIRRVRYGIQIENPLLKQIQLQHTDVYVSVLTGIGIIEKAEEISFNDAEIGFVCLHIIAAMNRNSKQGYIKTIFVCDEGQAVTSFLASNIQKAFPEIKIIERVSSDKLSPQCNEADVIFNATSAIIRYENVPTVSVTELLNEGSMSVIGNWIINREYEKLAGSADTLKDSFLYYRDQLSTKEELITTYSALLEEKGFVDKDFGPSALTREQTIPTTLGRGIALPHGSSDHVIHSCILIIKLEQTIEWSGHQVDLVFLTAVNQKDVEFHRSFFEQLFKIISNEFLLNEIKSIVDVEALKKILFPTK